MRRRASRSRRRGSGSSNGAPDAETGEVHTLEVVKRILLAEEEDILARLEEGGSDVDIAGREEAVARYRAATKVVMQMDQELHGV